MMRTVSVKMQQIRIIKKNKWIQECGHNFMASMMMLILRKVMMEKRMMIKIRNNMKI